MARPTMTSATNHEPAHIASATPRPAPTASTALRGAGTWCEIGARSRPTVSHSHTDTAGNVTPKINATIMPMSAPQSATSSTRSGPFAGCIPRNDSIAAYANAHSVNTSPGMPSVTSVWMSKLWAFSAVWRPSTIAYQSAPTALWNARPNPSGPQPVIGCANQPRRPVSQITVRPLLRRSSTDDSVVALPASLGRTNTMATAIAAVAAIAVAIVLVRPKLAGSATTLSSVLERLSNGRTVIWLTGLRGWLAHPITGWGPDGFGRAFQSAVGADWYAIVDGLQTAENAHNLLIQTLVTLGIPGLVLTLCAFAYAAIESFRGMQPAKGPERVLLVALWGALIGMIVALIFGVTLPAVSVWLWLTVGLLLAPISHRVPAPRRGVVAVRAGLGVALAMWAGSWLVADVIVGRAMQMEPGPAQVSALEGAVRLNPITPNYHWLVADALVNEALAEQRAGQSPQAVDETMLRAISAYDAAARVNCGDALVRAAFANVLVGYAARHPGTDAAQRAVEVAMEAVRLAPRNPAALGALARAYDVSGRHDDAEKTARLARSVAPAYAAQTLGSLGLDSPGTP